VLDRFSAARKTDFADPRAIARYTRQAARCEAIAAREREIESTLVFSQRAQA